MDIKTNKAAQSIDEFCVSHGISRALFYKILSQGCGPRVMKVGTRTLISEESAAAWRRQCEAQVNIRLNAGPDGDVKAATKAIPCDGGANGDNR
jgi:hypothetical protein